MKNRSGSIKALLGKRKNQAGSKDSLPDFLPKGDISELKVGAFCRTPAPSPKRQSARLNAISIRRPSKHQSVNHSPGVLQNAPTRNHGLTLFYNAHFKGRGAGILFTFAAFLLRLRF